MAVGNPYGRGAYGKGPYARYGSARAYGVGVYGVGPYSGWGGNTFDVAGVTGLVFAPKVTPHLIHQINAATGIVFNVSSVGISLVIHAQAVTEIVFGTQAYLAWSWAGWQPCQPGAWAAAAPCEDGVWTTPPGCGVGTWTPTRLVAT
ncbi:MAG TPA: hypothetical protein VGH84_14445 [Steroidobacteraceae bacterium]